MWVSRAVRPALVAMGTGRTAQAVPKAAYLCTMARALSRQRFRAPTPTLLGIDISAMVPGSASSGAGSAASLGRKKGIAIEVTLSTIRAASTSWKLAVFLFFLGMLGANAPAHQRVRFRPPGYM